MSTIRLYDAVNVGSNVAEFNTILAPSPPIPNPGDGEALLNLRMRLKTNTVGAGQYLVTVRWHDGVQVNSWDVALNPTAANYIEGGMQIWRDFSRAISVQVTQLAPGGSIDVRLIAAEA